MELTQSLTLIITERDLDQDLRATLEAQRGGHRVLGDENETRRVLLDALPSIISKRIKAIIPDGFGIGEIELSFSVDAKFWDTGIGGEIKVKLAPQSSVGR